MPKKSMKSTSFAANTMRGRGATTGEAMRYAGMKKKSALAAAAKRAAEGKKKKPGETSKEYFARMKADKYGNPNE